MNEQKLKNVQQWLEALQESARTAVEALSKDTPLAKDPPSIDERSKNLGAAIHKIRELVRPEQKTVAFLEESAWYHKHGTYHTPKAAVDFVMGNPPLNIPPAAEPIQPGAPQMVPGEQPWKAIESDSCGIIRHNGIVRAWAIRENAGVEVFAKQHFVDGKPSACWSFTGTVDCEKVIIGSIFCGRNKANQIVRFIRNGLLASRLRLKHKRMNRQAKAANPWLECYMTYVENDRNTAIGGYRQMMSDFRRGRPMVGTVGTWREVWMRERPGEPVPAECPMDWTPHGATYANLQAVAKAAAVAAVPAVPADPHPAPLSPEEELADTIKRQQEADAL